MTSQRRLMALRAMAAQSESPNEAAIAREKLALAAAEDDPDHDYRAWLVREEIAAEQQRAADEAVIAELVKRWEQGAFAGVSVNGGLRRHARFGRRQ